MTKNILLIDDDVSLRRVTEFNLQQAGFNVLTASSGKDGVEMFRQYRPMVLITDVKMPGISGYEVLEQVLALDPLTLVIVVTAFGSVEKAVQAMKSGAYDYLTKPFSRDQLILTVSKAFEFGKIRQENTRLKNALAHNIDNGQIIGQSRVMKKLLHRVAKVAASNASVLISGESGTGKEVIAKALHRGSERADAPFVAVNCAAIPKDLIESELFGHLKGSFTGAVKDRQGKFSLADGGTLFLDEIGEMPLELQPKLLRALQEQEIVPVGGMAEKVDVRVIAATNRNLEEAIRTGEFREDLYYRLAVVPIELAPLRERREDIPLFLDFFLRKHKAGTDIHFSDEVMARLQKYHWPGNVRELENLVEQMLILRHDNLLDVADLPPRIGRSPARCENILNLPDEGYSFAELEREAIEIALTRCGGNRTKAAKFLRIPRHVLIYRLEKHSIQQLR